MKANAKLALTLFAGLGLGAAATQHLHAQAAPPVYVVNEVDIADQAGFKAYAEAQTVLIQKNGGRYLARGGKITALDGAPPKRATIYAFDNADKLKAWQDDPAEKEVWAMRAKVGTFRTFAVEGVAN
jgi:uncharacterized protein (DUF1330 family)